MLCGRPDLYQLSLAAVCIGLVRASHTFYASWQAWCLLWVQAMNILIMQASSNWGIV